MNAELDSSTADRIAEIANKDLRPAAMGKGEVQLFEKKLSKEEKKALAAQKKAEREAKKKAANGEASDGDDGSGGEDGKDRGADKSTKGKGKKGDAEAAAEAAAAAPPGALHTCVCTGVLTSRKDSRDVKIENFSISVHGKQLFDDCTFELNYGRRYGMIGLNGSGKSTLLSVLAARMVEIPEHLDIWHLHEEAKPSDRSAIESVIDVVRDEQLRLEKLEEHIIETQGGDSPALNDIYEKLEKLDPSTFEKRAGELLNGLGFTQTQVRAQRGLLLFFRVCVPFWGGGMLWACVHPLFLPVSRVRPSCLPWRGLLVALLRVMHASPSVGSSTVAAARQGGMASATDVGEAARRARGATGTSRDACGCSGGAQQPRQPRQAV